MNIFLVWKLLSAVRGPPTAVFRLSSGPPTAVFRSNLDRRQQFSDQIWIADSSFQTKFWIADSSFQTHGSYLVFKLSLWGQFSQKPGMLRIEWPIPLRRARSELSYGPACQKGFTSPLRPIFSKTRHVAHRVTYTTEKSSFRTIIWASMSKRVYFPFKANFLKNQACCA